MITKENFCKIMRAMEASRKSITDMTEEMASVVMKHKKSQMINAKWDVESVLYDMCADDTLIDALMEVLENEMNDTNEWICYFIYDLDWGEKNKTGEMKVWDNDKNEIPLTCPEELYDMLTNDMKKTSSTEESNKLDEEEQDELIDDEDMPEPEECNEDCSKCCSEPYVKSLLGFVPEWMKNMPSNSIEDVEKSLRDLSEKYDSLFKKLIEGISNNLPKDEPKTGSEE